MGEGRRGVVGKVKPLPPEFVVPVHAVDGVVNGGVGESFFEVVDRNL